MKSGRRANARRPWRKFLMTVLLELDAVSKLYGALKAVDEVSLAVEEGEALAVIGPNGAGKSTMFNLITGDVAPTRRTRRVRRRRHDGDGAARRARGSASAARIRSRIRSRT